MSETQETKLGKIVLELCEKIELQDEFQDDEFSHPIELPSGLIVDIVVRRSVEMDRFDD